MKKVEVKTKAKVELKPEVRLKCLISTLVSVLS
jgi:hypothetical protein